ncbi:MAG: MogA/MoaB family molybdenum cofactor biosynthesis protein [Chloroflexota bacterium]
MGYHEHKEKAVKQVNCAVLTISDTRSGQSDESGPFIKERLEAEGHLVPYQRVIPNDAAAIRQEMERLLADGQVDVIVTSGGTGISRRDITIESISPYLEKRLDGFGELFRHLTYEEIGSGGIMSRAVAGIARGKIVVCLPGSPDAARVALDRLLLPELGHLVWEARK